MWISPDKTQTEPNRTELKNGIGADEKDEDDNAKDDDDDADDEVVNDGITVIQSYATGCMMVCRCKQRKYMNTTTLTEMVKEDEKKQKKRIRFALDVLLL